ncbi:MAG TPA: type II toxin-antitoxin system prevent-host-death family antitoxin [Patescibacteria group bacterium]|nr:type II toxin-antitoxin system prevent-host-death family antitoxin [Patescibacteria group bacterium]
MLDVNIEKILPVTEVRDSLNKIIDEVESTDELYVVTKNGKPSAIIVGVHHLEKLTGIDHKELIPATDLGGEKTDTSIDGPTDSLAISEPTTEPMSAQTPISPIAPVSGSPDNMGANNSASSTTISAMDETSAPPPTDPTGTPSGEALSQKESFGSEPATVTNNGAQASPLTTSSPSVAETMATPMSSTGLSTPPPTTGTLLGGVPSGPVINSDLQQSSGRYEQESNSGVSESQENDDSVDDIFGPVDEPELPVGTPPSGTIPMPTPTSNPITAQPASTSSTIAGPLPSISPAPAPTPLTQNPPTSPGQM